MASCNISDQIKMSSPEPQSETLSQKTDDNNNNKRNVLVGLVDPFGHFVNKDELSRLCKVGVGVGNTEQGWGWHTFLSQGQNNDASIISTVEA